MKVAKEPLDVRAHIHSGVNFHFYYLFHKTVSHRRCYAIILCRRESMHFMSEAKLRAESMGNFAYYNTSPARRSKWLTDSGASSLNAAEGFAAGPRNRSGCKSCDDVQIRMIDFAHTLPSPDGLTDTGYIHGLTSLIRALRGTLELMTVASVDEIIADVGSIMRRASENPSYITNK